MIRSWCGWFGVGLAATGAVTTIAAYAVWGSFGLLPPSSPPEPPDFGFWEFVLSALLVWLLLSLIRDIRYGPDPQDGELHLDESHAPSMILAMGLAATAVFRWIVLTNTFKLGEPGGAEAALAIGLSVTAVGLATAALTFRPRKKGWTGVLGGAAVAVLATATVLIAVMVVPVDATTTTKNTPTGAVPASVSRVAWRWESPNGIGVDAFVAGGGVVAEVGDGVVALDSATGRERWHYRRPGGFARGVMASPDGSTLMLFFDLRTVVLDAYTGDVLAENPPQWEKAHDMWLASDSVVTKERGQGRPTDLTGRRLTASKPTWRYTAPDHCRDDYFSDHFHRQVMARDVFAHVLTCDHRVKPNQGEPDTHTFTPLVLGLDPATGAEKWRYERKVSATSRVAQIYLSDDAKALSLVWGEREGVVLDQASGKVVAQERVTGSFRADGTFRRVVNDNDGGNWTAEWRSFGTGEVKRASFPEAELGEATGVKRSTGQAALDDALVVAYTSLAPGPQTSVAVLVTPWNTTDTKRIPIDHTLRSIDDYAMKLQRAPGALVLTNRMLPFVVGLV